LTIARFLRTTILEEYFKVVNIDSQIAKNSAEIRHKHKMPTANSIIAATALLLKAPCLSDGPHFKKSKRNQNHMDIKTEGIR